MSSHRLAEDRSLAYHRAIAERIIRDATVIARARALRQTTPFAGALSARERWQIFRRVNDAHRDLAKP